jgi:hypothetical protein
MLRSTSLYIRYKPEALYQIPLFAVEIFCRTHEF